MELGENDEVPLSVLKLFYEREAQVKADVERIASDHGSLGADASKIGNSSSVPVMSYDRSHSFPAKDSSDDRSILS